MNGMNGIVRQPESQPPTAAMASEYLRPQHQPQNNTKVALYQKLLKVMKDCEYIQRKGFNSFHRYRYATDADIKAKLHASLAAHGVLFFPSASVASERTERSVKDGKESLSTTTTVRVQFRFIDVDTGEFEAGEFVGAGSDPADKGAYKAITGAIKYILTSWFLIATGDDPEAEEKPRDEDRVEPKPRDGSLTAAEQRELQGYRREREQAAPQRKPAEAATASEPTLKVADMNAAFASIREQLGEEIWLTQLGLEGKENIAQFTSLREKRDFYKKLLAISRKAAA